MAKNAAPAMPNAAYAKDEEKWRAESDMRSLAEAEEIKRDSKRLAAAKACAKKKLAELKSVADVK